ncbi:Acid phosphatase 1 [Acorus calamus]|uniref:Acid phosphatase 1 n=1 Tax=Acorus calamus TaxID=4465 RepID=A0AAV9CDY0_ACOCL|nr:Acid phosphatase 1 [Acorus calamus]
MLDRTASAHRLHGISCLSCHLVVEINNIKDWKTVPALCEDYIDHYMLGDRYRKDSKVVADEAIGYAEGVELGGDGKDAWVFDVDETIHSNLPYYAQHGFGILIKLVPRERAYLEE